MKTYCRLIVVVVTLIALQAAGVTVHRSFRTREAGVGFGTGTAGVAYPVDAKIDKAIDERNGLWKAENPANGAETRERCEFYAF